MPSMRKIKIGRVTLRCDVAESSYDQRRGLEAYSYLRDGDALLFPFTPPRGVTFHAAKVSFPFDVIFVNERGKVAKVVHDVKPGSKDTWSWTWCSAVVEVPGGFCSRMGIALNDAVEGVETSKRWGALEGYSATPEATEPGDHSSKVNNRFQDRDLGDKSSPNRVDNPEENWEQEFGYDQTQEDFRTEDAPSLFRPSASTTIVRLAQNSAELPNGEIVDPVTFSLKAIEALASAAQAGQGLQWKKDPLEPSEEFAFITPAVIEGWLNHIGIGGLPSVIQAATSAQGLNTIGQAMILSDVATRIRMSPDGKTLVLYRASPVVPTPQY